MSTEVTNFKETMTSEATGFIQSQARALSIATSFDVEQRLAAISPLRLSSFYWSMAAQPRLSEPD